MNMIYTETNKTTYKINNHKMFSNFMIMARIITSYIDQYVNDKLI